MFERIKYAIVNFVASALFFTFFCLERKIHIKLFLLVILFVGFADTFFINGKKYGHGAYFCLIFNRCIGVGFALVLSLLAKDAFFWLGFWVYCLEMPTIILNQWEMISEDILMEQLQNNYLLTMSELDDLLSEEQKNTLNTLESVVDEDKMYLFIATFNSKEIQKLLNVELWGIALLIQKEDYEKMEKLANSIK